MAVQSVKRSIVSQLSRLTGHAESFIAECIERPKLPSHGQFAIPTPKLLRSHRERLHESLRDLKPVDLSKTLASKFHPTAFVASATPLGPYLNFTVQRPYFISHVIADVHTLQSKYGSHPSLGMDKTFLIDYSSPNIAKPFHAGHLRSTIIGGFVRNIYELCGWRVIGVNYLGDWGKQYGLLGVGYERYGDTFKLREDPIHHLFDVYVRISKDAESDPEINMLAQAYFTRMEQGDNKAISIWRQLRELSITHYKEIYSRLNISFDIYSGESEVTEYIPRVLSLLENNKLLKTREEDGAKYIDLNQYGLGVAVLMRGDDTSLYLTRDLAAILMRHERYKFDRAAYVIGLEQELHLQRLFKIAELAIINQDAGKSTRPALSLAHVGFGRVHGMSTRKGNVVFLEDILDSAKEVMRDTMRENERKYEEIFELGIEDGSENQVSRIGEEAIDYVAETVGVSAVMVQDMIAKRNKDYSFNWKRIMDVSGDTGVYLQYSHARLCGIERKAGTLINPQADLSTLQESEAFDLALLISRYPEVVLEAYEDMEPSVIVQYLFQLAHGISAANRILRVKGLPRELAEPRMLLFWTAKVTLANGLRLLGLTPLEKM